MNMILAAIDDVVAGTTNASVLYGMISALSTALVTCSLFLFNRITRTESRLQKQLKDEAENCEAEKVRMFEFSMKLVEYITALTKISCTASDCPVRKLMPQVPRATAEDMGMRPHHKKQ